MPERVLCVGNGRKQTLTAEILISQLQSKLGKQRLGALSPGPYPREGPGYLQRAPLGSVWRGAALLPLVIARLQGCPASQSPHLVFSHKQNRTIFLCATLLGPRCVLLSRGASPLQVCYAVVSGTFFFPTSEINEISISHFTQSDSASLFFFPPNK